MAACFCCKGFLEKEIRNEGDIIVVDTDEDPEAPVPREMVDMEVTIAPLFSKLGVCVLSGFTWQLVRVMR